MELAVLSSSAPPRQSQARDGLAAPSPTAVLLLGRAEFLKLCFYLDEKA